MIKASAGLSNKLRIMLPMISNVREVTDAQLLDSARVPRSR